MLKKVLLMTAVLLSLAYPKRAAVAALIEPIPECPPFCSVAR
jgi:hypothetical protein